MRGLQNSFPNFDIRSIMMEAGSARWELVEQLQGCNAVFGEVLAEPGLYRPRWWREPRVVAYGEMARVGGRGVKGPLLVLQGGRDEVVLPGEVEGVVGKTCGVEGEEGIEYVRYEGAGHVPVMYAAQSYWLKWVEERFEGRGVERGCVTRGVEAGLPRESYQSELNWFVEWAGDGYETS